MKQKKAWKNFAITVSRYALRGLFTVFFLGVFGIAYASNEENGGKIYANWMKEVFYALPTDFSTPLTSGTAKQAHTLVDEEGKFSAVAGSQKFAIGNEQDSKSFVNSSTEEDVQISGSSPTVKLSANSGNPEVQLKNHKGHAAIYFDEPSNELRVWVKDKDNTNGGENGLVIKPNSLHFPKGVTVQGSGVVSAFDCPIDEEGNQTFLKGFETNGEPICEPVKIYDWTREEFGPCEWRGITCMKSRTVECHDQNGTAVAYRFCFANKYFPRAPDEERQCPVYKCPKQGS